MAAVQPLDSIDIGQSREDLVISGAALEGRVSTNWKKIYFIAASALILIGIALAFFFNLPYLALSFSALGLAQIVVYHGCASDQETPPPESSKIKEPSGTKTPTPRNSVEQIEGENRADGWYEEGEDRAGNFVGIKSGARTLASHAPFVRAGIRQMQWTQGEAHVNSRLPPTDTQPFLNFEETMQSDGESDSEQLTDQFKQELLLRHSSRPTSPESPPDDPKDSLNTLSE